MTEHFAHPALEMLNNFQVARFPENVQVSVADGIAKAREAHRNMAAAAKDGMKAVEDVMLATQSGARTLGDKVFSNTITNIESCLDTVEAMARAKTMPEAVALQGKFLQAQLVTGSEQAKALFELSTKVAGQTFDSFNVAVMKSLAQFKDVR